MDVGHRTHPSHVLRSIVTGDTIAIFACPLGSSGIRAEGIIVMVDWASTASDTIVEFTAQTE